MDSNLLSKFNGTFDLHVCNERTCNLNSRIMGLFGLLNYENYLLSLIVNSQFARNGLVILLLYLVTALVRFHLSIVLCIVLTLNNPFDVVSPVIISVLLSMASDTLFKYVETHRPFYETIVEYVITNYSEENFIRWKRMVLISICVYVLFILLTVQIDNYYLFVSIVQTIASFLICDFLEQKMPHAMYNYLMNWWNRPRTKQTGRMSRKRSIISDYRPLQKTNRRPRSRSLDSRLVNTEPTNSRPNNAKSNNAKPNNAKSNNAKRNNAKLNSRRPARMTRDFLPSSSIVEVHVTPIPPKPPTPPMMKLHSE